ncbi:MAG: TIGR04211 family SH3 domain-containing protein [Gammaproteobacteria bacterium]|nr:TIGR04211 family SH3 domain-containing protein [Gammaproteobacteria bacterium]
MKRALRCAAASLLAALCLCARTAGAETLFVTDTIEIGIHESKNLDSVIIAVVPSGTPLEVVSRDGDFAEVRTTGGITGWVDTRYVVSQKPETTRVNENDAKLEEARRALGDARAEAEVLRQRVKELERDAQTAAAHPPATVAITDPGMPTGEDAARLAEARQALEVLTTENRALKDTITELEAAASASTDNAAASYVVEPEPAAAKVRHGSLGEVAQSWTVWQWMLLAFVLLLAFALGGYAVDWEMRRRHGGFRI